MVADTGTAWGCASGGRAARRSRGGRASRFWVIITRARPSRGACSNNRKNLDGATSFSREAQPSAVRRYTIFVAENRQSSAGVPCPRRGRDRRSPEKRETCGRAEWLG